METSSNVCADKIKEILTRYINEPHRHISDYADKSIYTQTKSKKIDAQFEKDLNAIATTLPQITWKLSSKMHFLYHYTYEQVILLKDVLPLTGLEIMVSVPNSVFDVSLLEYYHSILDYCRKNSAIFKGKNVFNLPDIIDSVTFLLNRKEIQEQLATLPKDETLEPNTRDTTFTQEKFSQLLFLCLETNTEKGRAIFEEYASKIQVTPALLNSVISSYSDNAFQRCQQIWVSENPATSLPQKVLNNVLTQYVSDVDTFTCNPALIRPEKTQATTDAFERAIKRISSVSQKIRWEKPENYVYISDKLFFLHGTLPLTGLKIMASLPNSEFDVSLFNNCLQALVCGTVKDKKVLNLSNVLDVIVFLLEEKGMQEQLALLPLEETVDGTVRYLTFTREKFTQLLLLCRETNLSQGLAIFERHGPNIQATPQLLSLLVNASSDAMFKWCAEKWIAENPKRHFPKEVMVNMLSNTFALYLSYTNNFYQHPNQQATLQTATESFKSSLNKIIILNKNIKWDSSIPLAAPAHLCVGETIFLSNVLPLTALEAMESSSPNVFDVSLLTQYYKALDYCRKNSDTLKNKEI
ncbi:MAG TPA: hypothetical protein VGU44_05970, partial [Gammaproteobacteria bacterium]|nr:hypothetical protein [Gammaproteobacteria bacterium]